MSTKLFSSLGSSLSAMLALIACKSCCFIRALIQMRGARFVGVVYDDWHGIKRPVGVIHMVKCARGECREVFTFCAPGKRQPEIALFVKNRTGNLADQIALTFEDQDTIPTYLKCLPEHYKEQYLRAYSLAS